SDDPGLGRAVGDRVRVAFLPRDRGDVDDAPVLALHHLRGEGAAAQELAGEVDLEHALPFLDGIVRGGNVQARDAGVVDEHVDPAEVGERLCRRAFYRRGIRDVDGAGLRGRVPDAGPRAGGLEALRNRRADALQAAGDDGGAPFEIELVHSFTAPVMPDT